MGEIRPAFHTILLKGNRGKLFSVLYTAGGSTPRPTVLLLHGIPGNEQNADLAQHLRRLGFNVFTFHYSGCFGSDGDYSLENDLQDAETALDFILQDKKFNFDKSNIFAVGHSLGSFVCGGLSAKRKEIKASVFITPCNIGRLEKIKYESPKLYQKTTEFLEETRLWLNGVKQNQFLKEIVEHKTDYPLESKAKDLNNKPILIIEGSLDEVTPPKYHSKPFIDALKEENHADLEVLTLETDHFLSDKRLELAEAVSSFLQKNIS